MPKEVSKYPPGTYGAYMDELANRLQEKVMAIQRMKNDPKWQQASKDAKEKSGGGVDPVVQEMRQLQNDARKTMAQLSIADMWSQRGGRDLNSPVESDKRQMDDSVDSAANLPQNRAMFDPKMVDGTANLLGLNGNNPPSHARIIRNYSEYRDAYEQTKEAETPEARQTRMREAQSLLTDLKNSTQKSFMGKLKSFFVGNSKEYNNALAAMENVAQGGDPAQAKDAIKKYLDLRGNKVRDHQYGRDRFDAMMKGLALVSRPKEFENFCQDLTEARQARSNGAYKGKLDPMDYQPAEVREAAMRQQDIERIKVDSNGGISNRQTADFFSNLRKATKATPELEEYALVHPGVRDAARKIAQEKGLRINIPKTPTGLDENLTGKLEKLGANAQEMAKLSQTQRETEPTREPAPARAPRP